MTDQIENRGVILRALREELVGPCPIGDEIDCSSVIKLDDIEAAYRSYCQLGSGEEILQRDSPTKRYGVGVLYPMNVAMGPAESNEDSLVEEQDNDDVPQPSIKDVLATSAVRDYETMMARNEPLHSDTDLDDFDLSSANTYKPSSMAVSLLIRLPKDAELVVTATGGRYENKPVTLAGRDREWWLRSPVRLTSRFRRTSFPSLHAEYITAHVNKKENIEDLNVHVEVFARPYPPNADDFLVTVCLVNREQSAGRLDLQSLFQCHMNVEVQGEGSTDPIILPYPTAEPSDSEERSQELLYRGKLTFGVGHGCAADWECANKGPHHAIRVSAECLPTFETPNITPDIRNEYGQPLGASMRLLAGLESGTEGFEELSEIVSEYERWITEQESRIVGLSARLQGTAKSHIEACKHAALRMRDGLSLIQNDAQIRQAFQLANLAMLIQQMQSRREARFASFDHASSMLVFKEPYEALDLYSENAKECRWRAFQIAFILTSLRSTADGGDLDRERVELIWFPTGGGKTEAYLGLAAFSIFLRRLRNSDDTGVQALMRYTLRLLTAQQFQRASRLICAMEYIRRKNLAELGSSEISIGVWLGGDTTPNTRDEALTVFRSLAKGDNAKENKFVLDRCPWCGAQMGPVNLIVRGRGRRGVPKVIGYSRLGNTVAYACPDRSCEFHDSLPLYVVDEDIYEKRPALLIGTVDKFAMLAWRPQARALFGIAENGTRNYSPPGLIIQDELHLISGPLGSMVGLYESIIEELCTDRRGKLPVRPKIVSSTATIRNYDEQVLSLYARKKTSLFPPPGLDADDSFFAKVAYRIDGSLERGRIYVGVHAPGLGSLQTVQVRTFSALLQAPHPLGVSDRDPWWTLLLFFNSLRELGTTLTLFQSDIPDFLKGALRQRLDIGFRDIRQIRKIMELTGRLPGDEVSKAITELEVPTDSQQGQSVDVCLSSNIIEVGVDIDRLSLMSIVGQPKTTSQYIQVTGRVGRKQDRPGLVVTIYAASKPRDRSHFEKFRSYHERLYSQVEPTSVTPFSRPALDRAVHAVMASYVRQFGDSDQAESPSPFPTALIDSIADLLNRRAEIVDPGELDSLRTIFSRRANEWQRWQRLNWDGTLSLQDVPLMRPAGAYVAPDKARVSWATPLSLRNVDAECQVEITQLYMLNEMEDSRDA
ncbi:helicase-related protein [Saccharospirillum sp. HFRX-1]|uniref:helicase-related protein n=1 Tax=unclassified Saccharospirillum TaxID=2633430 RepID=UPI0037248F67